MSEHVSRAQHAVRPGAMTVAMRAFTPSLERFLRVAVVRGGRIELDELVRTKETASVGGTERDRILVPGLPARVHFRHRDGGFDAILPKGSAGKLSNGAAVESIAALTANGDVKVRLSPQARGRIELGDVAILFQSVPAFDPLPKPQLPASVRGGFVAGVDWTFTSFVTATLLACFSFVVFLEQADFPIPNKADEYASAEYVLQMVQDMLPPPPPPEDTGSIVEPPDDSAPSDAAPSAPSDTTPTHTASNDHRAPRPHATREPVDTAAITAQATQAVLDVLGTDAPGSAFTHLVDTSAVADSSADLFAMVDGASTADRRDQLLTTPRGQTAVASTSIENLARAPSTVHTSVVDEGRDVEEHAVTIRVDREEFDPIDIPETFDEGALLRAVRARMSSIRACYTHELSRTGPSLEGKIVSEMTIEEMGTVSRVTTEENTTGSASLAECVSRNLRTIRVAPIGGVAHVAFPFVFHAEM